MYNFLKKGFGFNNSCSFQQYFFLYDSMQFSLQFLYSFFFSGGLLTTFSIAILKGLVFGWTYNVVV